MIGVTIKTLACDSFNIYSSYKFFFKKKKTIQHLEHEILSNIWVCLKIVYPIVPNGLADHYPVFKWLFHWEYKDNGIYQQMIINNPMSIIRVNDH